MRFHSATLAAFLAAQLLAQEPGPSPRRVDRDGDAVPAEAVLRLGPAHPAHSPTAVVFADGGKAIFTGTNDELCRWDAATGKMTKRIAAAAQVLAVSPDGMRIIGGATFGDAAVWNAVSLERTGLDTSGFMGDLLPPVFQAGPTAVFVGRSRHGHVVPHGWDKAAAELKPYRSNKDTFVSRFDWAFAVTPDGRSAVIADAVIADGGVRVPRKEFDVETRLVWWDFVAGTATRTHRNGRLPAPDDKAKKLDPADFPVAPRVFLPGGRAFVAESDYGFLLLRGDTGERVRVLCPRWRLAVERASADRRVPFALSPDGRLLAVGRDRGILLIETVSGCIRWNFDPLGPVAALAFSPDGARLASVGGGGPLVWDVYAADGRPADEAQLRSETSAAHRAMAVLLRDPDRLVAVAKGVPEVMKIDAARIRRRLQELDSPRYAVREAAQAELARLPVEVRPMIEAHLKTPGLSAEAVARTEKARDALPVAPPPEDGWRLSRVLEAVERLNTPAARREMARLAAGETGYPLTVEATESLQRMNRRAETK